MGKSNITIKIDTTIRADLATVWNAWNTPDDIKQWNFASEDWCCPRSEVNLTVGGKFNNRMEAKDGSMGFDFEGTYTNIEPMHIIEYVLADERKINIEFILEGDYVRVIEAFDAEDQNSAELQRQGWQSILDNFKKHVEGK